jgi:hypothetical protein
LGSRTTVTGRLLTSLPQTSQVLLPLMLNHFKAHSLWAKAISPRQLHSIFKVSPYSSMRSSMHIRHTACTSEISWSAFMSPIDSNQFYL